MSWIVLHCPNNHHNDVDENLWISFWNCWSQAAEQTNTRNQTTQNPKVGSSRSTQTSKPANEQANKQASTPRTTRSMNNMIRTALLFTVAARATTAFAPVQTTKVSCWNDAFLDSLLIALVCSLVRSVHSFAGGSVCIEIELIVSCPFFVFMSCRYWRTPKIHTHAHASVFVSTVLDHVGRTIALSCCVDSGRRYWYRCGKARDSSLALHPTDSHAPCVLPFSRRIVNLHVSILTIYLVRDGSHDFLLTTLVSKYTNAHGCIHDNTVWTVPSRLP